MSNLPKPALLTTSGTYEFEVIRGRSYLMTFRGEFGGAHLSLNFKSDVTGQYEEVEDASWNGDGTREVNFRAETSSAQLLLDDASGTTAIAIIITPWAP